MIRSSSGVAAVHLRRVPRAQPRRRSRPRAGARIARCCAPISAAGDVRHPRWRPHRQTARRRAGDRERGPRLPGRDALCRARSAAAPRRPGRAPRYSTPCAPTTGSILVFLPGQAEIARTAERLQNRVPADTEIAPLYGQLSAGRAGSRHRSGAGRPAQGRARHLDRRNLAHHRGHPHRHRFRLPPRAAPTIPATGLTSLVTAARLPRRRRSAPRPRRPHRAGHRLSPLDRSADRRPSSRSTRPKS